jgi:hypothetical protein
MNEKPLWSAVASDANAEPIRIVDLDVAKTTWSRVHETMRVVHLRLNRQPDPHWIRFFHEERESRINARRAGIWIEDGYIAFDCLLPEVESHHMPDIRRSVDYANERSLALITARLRERGAQAAADRSERLELEQLRKRVRDLVDPRAVAGRTAPAPAATGAQPPAVAKQERVVDRGADRRAADRRTAAGAANPVPPKTAPAAAGGPAGLPAGAPVAAARSAAPADLPSDAAPPLADAALGTGAPVPEATAGRAPEPVVTPAPLPDPVASAPRSLEATLDDYRAALREARERSAQAPDAAPDKNR